MSIFEFLFLIFVITTWLFGGFGEPYGSVKEEDT